MHRRAALFGILGLSLLLWPFDSGAQTYVIDGDTISIDGARIRLFGIDAPEKKQTCRRANGNAYDCSGEATAALKRLIGTLRVECREQDRDRYRRSVAICYANGRDLGQELVRQGWALAFRRYSRRYVPDEDHARQRRLGMWQGEFVPPWEYRRR